MGADVSSFLGVDYGSRRVAIACLVLDEKNPDAVVAQVWVRRYPASDDVYTVLGAAYDLMTAADTAMRPLVIAIESPIVGANKNAQTAVKLSMMAGALCAAAGKGTSGILLVAPSTWKAEVVGRGNASKSDVVSWLRVRHPGLVDAASQDGKVDQDVVDALCLALHAHRSVGGRG